MNKFKYRIYYKYLGPSRADPFATSPLTSDQVQNGFDKLRATLPKRYSASIEGNSLIITDTTNEAEEDSIIALEPLIIRVNMSTRGLSLLAEKLSTGAQ